MRGVHALGRALAIAGSMTWESLLALVLGFALSAVVQAVGQRETVSRSWVTTAPGRWSWPPASVRPAPRAPTRPWRWPGRCSQGCAFHRGHGVRDCVDQPGSGRIHGGVRWWACCSWWRASSARSATNHTTFLNIVFLVLGGALLVRFFASGGAPMLRMMGGRPPTPETPD